MKIRQLKESDVSKLSLLHIKSLPLTVSSKIGRPYLECIYKSALKNETNCISLVATENDLVIGVIVASKNLSRFQSNIKRELFPTGYVQVVISLVTLKFTPMEIVNRIKFEKELVKSYKGKYASIVILFTDVKYRQKGVATKLIREVVKYYKGKVDNIYVDTLRENKAAIKLYESLRFKLQINIGDSSLFLLKSQWPNL